MSAPARSHTHPDALDVLVGYDGSAAADYAITAAAMLLPGAAVRVAHLWAPALPSAGLRLRLESQASSVDELMGLLKAQGQRDAERVAARGVAVAADAGWSATPLVELGLGDPGFSFALLAEREHPAVVVVGARGLSGTRAVLGSVSDSTVHYSPVPVLVVPEPAGPGEYRGAVSGPIVVGWDGSPGAEQAVAAAAAVFPGRRLLIAVVGDHELTGAALDLVDSGVAELARVERDGGLLRRGRSIAEALESLAGEVNAAAVVVGRQGRSARREILLGSACMAVLHHVRRPVLVVPRAAEDA